MVIQASLRQLGRLKYLNCFKMSVFYVGDAFCLFWSLWYSLPSGTASVSLSFSYELIYPLFFSASFKLPVCPCVWLWQACCFHLQEPQFSSSIKGTRGCVLAASQISVWGYQMQSCMKWLEDGDKLLKYQQAVLLWGKRRSQPHCDA